ncbi:unnamed protein product [Thelazia callipaeda]|uniref:GpcrRhopsn4 domain-containing protein n=1 Tax=Thelazia callipaeda TaxID=103827 RepID=A0A0N5D3B0_THECL|nr:unnamed protein product [Thelazia callipaeda]
MYYYSIMHAINPVSLFICFLCTTLQGIQAVRIIGSWNSRSSRFSIVAKFGFQQVDPLDVEHSRGFVYGNISSQTVSEARGVLFIVPRTLIDAFAKADNKQSCEALLQNMDSLIFESRCFPKGKWDVMRWVPCPTGKLCIEEDKPEKVINGSQMTLRIMELSIPQYWYVVLAACYLDSRCLWKSSVKEINVNYDLWLTNGNPQVHYLNPFGHQFSFEQQGIFSAHFFGEMACLMSVSLMCLLLLLLSSGWSFYSTSGVSICSKIVLFWGLLTFAHFLLFFVIFFFVGGTLHLFKSWPGCLVILIRVLQAVWFMVHIRHLINEENYEQKAVFLAHFGAGFLVWFVYYVGLGIIISFVSDLWRFKIVLVLTAGANFVAVACLVYLFWPTNPNRNYFQADFSSHMRFSLTLENEDGDFENLLLSNISGVDMDDLPGAVS